MTRDERAKAGTPALAACNAVEQALARVRGALLATAEAFALGGDGPTATAVRQAEVSCRAWLLTFAGEVTAPLVAAVFPDPKPARTPAQAGKGKPRPSRARKPTPEPHEVPT